MIKNNYRISFAIFFFIVFLYRLFVLENSHVDLFFDEAYYWYWSLHPSFGYYSKPPMVAWMIYIFTHLCGDSIFCIKLPALIFHSLTAIIVYFIADELFNDDRLSFYSGISYLTLPLISFLSMAITTDAFLLFFWAFTLLFFIKALKYNNLIYWILAGIGGGLGLLSKYTMLVFGLSVFLYLCFSKEKRWLLKNKYFYISIIISILIYIPNFIWQINHDFISFHHTKDISDIDKLALHIDKLIEFLMSQFAVFGPVFFSILIFLLFKPYIRSERFKLLYIFTYTILFIISFVAILGRAFANWAAPAYVAGTILIVAYLLFTKKEKLLKIGIAVNIIMAISFYHYHTFLKILDIEISSKIDPYKRVLGWHQLAEELKPLIKKYPNSVILYDDRKTMSEMVYYLRTLKNPYVMYNPTNRYRNQFDMDTNINEYKTKDFIYITKSKHIDDVRKVFGEVNLLKSIKIKVNKDFYREYYVYYLKKYRNK